MGQRKTGGEGRVKGDDLGLHPVPVCMKVDEGILTLNAFAVTRSFSSRNMQKNFMTSFGARCVVCERE